MTGPVLQLLGHVRQTIQENRANRQAARNDNHYSDVSTTSCGNVNSLRSTIACAAVTNHCGSSSITTTPSIVETPVAITFSTTTSSPHPATTTSSHPTTFVDTRDLKLSEGVAVRVDDQGRISATISLTPEEANGDDIQTSFTGYVGDSRITKAGTAVKVRDVTAKVDYNHSTLLAWESKTGSQDLYHVSAASNVECITISIPGRAAPITLSRDDIVKRAQEVTKALPTSATPPQPPPSTSVPTPIIATPSVPVTASTPSPILPFAQPVAKPTPTETSTSTSQDTSSLIRVETEPSMLSAAAPLITPLRNLHSHAMAQAERLVPRVASETASAALSRAGRVTLNLAENYGTARQVAALEDIRAAKTRLGAIAGGDISNPTTVAKHYNSLASSAATFHKSVATRIDYLQQRLQAAEISSALKERLNKQIASLQQLADKEILLRKDLLTKQVLTDQSDSIQRSAQKALLKMREGVGTAYDRSIARASDVGPSPLQGERKIFFDALKDFQEDAPKGLVTRTRDALGRWYEEKMPWAKDVTDRAVALGQTKLGIPGNPLGRIADYLENRATSRTSHALQTSTEILNSELPHDSKDITKQLRSLEQAERVIDSRLARLSRSGQTVPQDEKLGIAELQERSNAITLRRKELLEKQISITPEDASLKAKLYGNNKFVGKIEAALGGKDTNLDSFKVSKEGYQQELLASKAEQRLMEDPEVARAVRASKLAKEAHRSASDDLKYKTPSELSASAHQESLAKLRVTVQQLEDALYHDPKNQTIERDLQHAQQKLADLPEAHKKELNHVAQSQRTQLDTHIKELNAELNSSQEQTAKAPLELERLKATARRTALGEDLEAIEKNTEPKATLKRIDEVIAKTQQSILDASDPKIKTQAESALAELHHDANETRAEIVANEIEAAGAQRKAIKKALADIDEKMRGPGLSGEDKTELQDLKKHLESKDKALATAEDYFGDQKKLIDVELKISELNRNKAQHSSQTGSDANKGDIATLEKEIAQLENDLKTAQEQFNSKWNNELQQAKSRFASMVESSKDYARRNPIKTGIGMAMAAEGIRGALIAGYEDDARHPLMVPTLLYMLNRDLEDWQFTTKQGGIAASILAESFNSSANAGIFASSLVAGQRGAVALDTLAAQYVGRSVGQTAAAQKVAEKLATKMAGRALGGVGAAIDGAWSFAGGEFVNDTNLQLTGRTASPIAFGAGFGAFFGPPGAIIGGTAGAVGEAGGAIYYLHYALPSEIDADWKKRGVRDSVRMAQQGFVFPDDHQMVMSREPLSPEEGAALETLAREALLNRLFNPAPGVGWTQRQLAQAGFRVANGETSAEERREIDTHNWEHAKKLLEGRSWYNPVRWGYGGYLEDLRSTHPDLANQFKNIHRDCRQQLEKLYNTSMQVRYVNQEGGVATSREFNEYIAKVAGEFEVAFAQSDKLTTDAEERGALSQRQWEFLGQRFPQLGLIMSSEYDRQLFVNNFNSSLKNPSYPFNDYAIWKDAAGSEIGIPVLVAAGMAEVIADRVKSSVADYWIK